MTVDDCGEKINCLWEIGGVPGDGYCEIGRARCIQCCCCCGGGGMSMLCCNIVILYVQKKRARTKTCAIQRFFVSVQVHGASKRGRESACLRRRTLESNFVLHPE